ncbi:MAG: glycosyltransferase family 39 protein [Patescibacteria group bacterium]|nr:glycosyltransferase family 39 protein [Patescibacteria group bacterium]
MIQTIFLHIKPNRERYMLGILLVLACITGWAFLDAKPLHLDEVATIAISNGDGIWEKMWKYEGNMWFYYFFIHHWLILGSSEFILRFPSILFGVAALIPIYYIGRDLYGLPVARLSVILLALHPLFVRNMQYARAYTLMALFAALATYFFINMQRKNSSRLLVLAYAISGVLAIYAHVYAIFLLIAHGLYVLTIATKERIFRIGSAAVIVALGILPLLMAPSGKGSMLSWLGPPDFFSVVAGGTVLLGDWLPLAGFSGLLLGFVLLRDKFRFWFEEKLRLQVLMVIVPFTIAIAVSLAGKPIYTPQYLSVSLPAVVLLVAYAVCSVCQENLRKSIIAILLFLSLIRLGYWYAEVPLRYVTIPNKNAEWDRIVLDIANAGGQPEPVLVLPTYTHIVYDYYAYHLTSTRTPALPLRPSNLVTGISSPFETTLLEEVKSSASRVWVVYNKRAGDDDTPEFRQVRGVLAPTHRITQTMPYYETTVYLYEKR